MVQSSLTPRRMVWRCSVRLLQPLKSSSRVTNTLTGLPVTLARSAASGSTPRLSLAPKPPPTVVVTQRTSPSPMPKIRRAMVFLARWAFWLGDHTVSRPCSSQRATATSGSMCACFWRELRPLNSTTWADPASACLQIAAVEGVVDHSGDVVLPALVDHAGAGLESLLGVEHGGQLLVLHVDEVERLLGRVDVDGRHGGDPVTHVARLVRKDVLVLVLALVGEGRQPFGHHRAGEGHLGDVLVSEDRSDAREGLGFGRVDLHHPGVRVGAHEDTADEHAGQCHVGPVDGGPRRLAGRVRLGEGLADDGEAVGGEGVCHDPCPPFLIVSAAASTASMIFT